MFVAFAKIFVDSGKLDYNLRPSSGELLLMYMQSKSFVSAYSAVKLKLYMHWHVTWFQCNCWAFPGRWQVGSIAICKFSKQQKKP